MEEKCLNCVFVGTCRRQDTAAADACRQQVSVAGQSDSGRVALSVVRTERTVTVLTTVDQG